MSPSDRRLLERIARRAKLLSPAMQKSLERAFEAIRESYSEHEIEELLDTGDIDRVLDAFADEVIREHMAPVRETLRSGIADAARSFTRDLPGRAATISFDALSPRVIDGIRQLESRVMTSIADELVREPVRAFIEDGLARGVGPRTTARHLRTVLGLSRNQVAAIRNFERMLATGDREALTRQLRDKRFDSTLDKALGENGTGLTTEQIDRMTEAYRKRMIAFNAETHARTASLDAQRLGQRLSWENAIASGVVERSQLRKRWVTAGDLRVREEHVAMNGQVVGFDDIFSNGESIPGSSTYNCRCLASYFLARAS